MPEKTWFKLDNAANIYPPTHSKNWAAMFRLSATLNENIDIEILKTSLEHALVRFPSFSCRLKRGFFWYYFDRINGIPPIKEDVRNPMTYLRLKDNRYFMFSVRYYRNRVSLEFFHAVTDGMGGLTFLLSIVREYIRLRYGENIPVTDKILSCSDSPSPEEYEDSFLKYARKHTISRSEPTAYHPTGTPVARHEMLITSGKVDTASLKELAKSYGVTVGVMLAAILNYSVYQKQMTEKSAFLRKKWAKVSVPVNLRRFYPTKTLRNFSSYINPGIDPKLGEYTFDEILVQVKSAMDMYVNEKQLNGRFSGNVSAQKLWVVRAMPLLIKSPVLKCAYLINGDRYLSSTITNLGQIDIPEEMEKYLIRLDFILGQPGVRRSDCAVISCGGNTYINFSRTFAEADIERRFFTFLVRNGVKVFIESNGRCL